MPPNGPPVISLLTTVQLSDVKRNAPNILPLTIYMLYRDVRGAAREHEPVAHVQSLYIGIGDIVKYNLSRIGRYRGIVHIHVLEEIDRHPIDRVCRCYRRVVHVCPGIANIVQRWHDGTIDELVAVQIGGALIQPNSIYVVELIILILLESSVLLEMVLLSE